MNTNELKLLFNILKYHNLNIQPKNVKYSKVRKEEII
jgi:hypothetical protein